MKKKFMMIFIACSTITAYADPIPATLICDNGWQKYAMSTHSSKLYEASSSENVSDADITQENYENSEGIVTYNKKTGLFSVDNRNGCVPLTMKTIKLMKGNVIVLSITNEDDHSIESIPCYWRVQ